MCVEVTHRGTRLFLPEPNADPDLILPETEATLFNTLLTTRAWSPLAALTAIPGL